MAQRPGELTTEIKVEMHPLFCACTGCCMAGTPQKGPVELYAQLVMATKSLGDLAETATIYNVHGRQKGSQEPDTTYKGHQVHESWADVVTFSCGHIHMNGKVSISMYARVRRECVMHVNMCMVDIILCIRKYVLCTRMFINASDVLSMRRIHQDMFT